MRRLRYWTAYVSHYWPAILFAPLIRRGIQRDAESSFAGINIVNGDRHQKIPPRFAAMTIAALELIHSVDPRRFRRLQREITAIVHQTYSARATYNPAWRACSLDFRLYHNEKHPEWGLWTYATLLIHEATHGAIFSRRITYSYKLRSRIERLCQTEARRFASRADREDRRWSDTLVPTFDERQWHTSWNRSFMQRWREYPARVTDNRKPL